MKFLSLFKSKSKNPIKQLKDVKVGDRINIEWNRIKGGIGDLKCLGNDPKTKKIYLEVQWQNYKEANTEESEIIILEYNNKAFANFNLLNQTIVEDPIENAIDIIQQKMNYLINEEKYEDADKLQQKLTKIIKGE